jgi:mono/diheme cytochrome c family protein
MKEKLLAISLVFILMQPAVAQQPEVQGKKIYENKCARCHGKDGTRGLFGAKNLKVSRLNDNDLYKTISNGRDIMPSWKDKLTPESIQTVIRYVKTLRSNYNRQ